MLATMDARSRDACLPLTLYWGSKRKRFVVWVSSRFNSNQTTPAMCYVPVTIALTQSKVQKFEKLNPAPLVLFRQSTGTNKCAL